MFDRLLRKSHRVIRVSFFVRFHDFARECYLNVKF